jgi:hypothetical protein
VRVIETDGWPNPDDEWWDWITFYGTGPRNRYEQLQPAPGILAVREDASNFGCNPPTLRKPVLLARRSPVQVVEMSSSILPRRVLATLLGVGAGVPRAPTDAGRRTPVITLTLIAGESVHVATISEAVRADSAIPSRRSASTGSSISASWTTPVRFTHSCRIPCPAGTALICSPAAERGTGS